MSDAAKKILKEFMEHCNYINSFADLISYCYDGSIYEKSKDILKKIEKDETFFNQLRYEFRGNKEKAFSNLRNSWYHELAFLEPIGDASEDRIIRMKFAPWKIIQFYYSVFSGISSIVRCIKSYERIGHKKMINIFTNELLIKKELCNKLFVSPYCFVLNTDGTITPFFYEVVDWEHGLSVKCPILERCFKKIQNKTRVSIFHYFWKLRNWITYQDSYIFRRFYGKTLKWNLDYDLKLILNTFLTLTEVFMIWAFGYNEIEEEKNLFIYDFNQYFEKDVVNNEKLTSHIERRFKYYKELL